MSDGDDITAADGQKNGKPPVVTVDQEWPLFTVDSGAPAKAAPPGDQTPNVTAVLRDVLGWRPLPDDPKAFVAALNASFTLTDVEGHVESSYVPRGFSMQADLGAVSGGQASLYARARSSLVHMLQLLDGLTPLRPDFDVENGAAVRALLRSELNRIVDETGLTGGPRSALVDSSFLVVLGEGSLSAGSADLDQLTGDVVGGQLGRLREVFGLVDANVNTVEEERVRTSFWTLVDEVLDLRRAWGIWNGVLRGGDTGGFLGTDLVLISRQMEAASEQVDEYEEVLDSVLVGSADRQTIWLDRPNGLTLDGLLSWTRQFLRVDGPAYLNDSGRDGLGSAFLPTARQLQRTYAEKLLDLVLNPPGGQKRPLPSGLYAARSVVALSALHKLLSQLAATAELSAPLRPPTPLEVEFRPLGADAITGEELAQAQKDLDAAKARRKAAAVEVERAAILHRQAQAAGAGVNDELATVRQRFERAVAKVAVASPNTRATAEKEADALAPTLNALEALDTTNRDLVAAHSGARAADDAEQAAQRRMTELQGKPTGKRTILVTVRIDDLVPGLMPAFPDGSDWVVPVTGSVTENDDSVSGRFVIEPPLPDVGFLNTLDRPVTLGPDQVPLALLSSGSREVVVRPAQATWPATAPGTWPVHQRSGVGSPALPSSPRYRAYFGGDRSGNNG